MRIAQVCHLFPPATGGIEHHTYELTRQLVAGNKNDVTVFTCSMRGVPKQEKTEGFTVKRFFSIDFPVFSSVRFPPALFFSLIRSDFDLYCSHGYGSLMPLITAIAAWYKKKPFVFTLHGYPKLKGVGGFFQKIYKMLAASIFLKIASKVIVVSRVSIDDIKGEVDERKLVYVPNGINAEDFSCDSYQNKQNITYVGRLDKYKGIDRLIWAFARLPPEIRAGLNLRIVGRDEGIRKDLEAIAKTAGVQPEFVEVPYSKIKEVYCSSKAIVLPSHYEGFSLVWLEAIASCRPMFSTPVGDAGYLFDQVYGENAQKFLFRDEDELAVKLAEFIRQQPSYAQVLKRAEAICKQEYSWENVAALTFNVYRDALGDNEEGNS